LEVPEEDSTKVEESSEIESAVEDEIVPDKTYFSSQETFSKTKTQISSDISEQNQHSIIDENLSLKVLKKSLKSKKLTKLTKPKKIPLSGDILDLEENWQKRGVESSRPLKCSECDFIAFNTKPLVRHWIKSHKIVVFECRKCSFFSQSSIDIMEHYHSQHKVPQ
jgi:hypothetical protein